MLYCSSPVVMFLLDCDGTDGGCFSSTEQQSRAPYVPERLTYGGPLYIEKSAFSQYQFRGRPLKVKYSSEVFV
jgi:hypothetical protein